MTSGTAGADRRLVVIGASAGGIEALKAVLGGLPSDLPCPVLVVQHIEPRRESMLASILSRGCVLPVKNPRHGTRMRAGTAYLAVPDRHLEIAADGRLALTHTPRLHFVRPFVDTLFASASRYAGPGTLAVVLSGSGVDGADGVRAVHAAGGHVIVESLDTATFTGMPRATIATGCIDAVLPREQVAPAIVKHVTG